MHVRQADAGHKSRDRERVNAPLPLWPLREPKHEPVEGIVLFAEVGRKEERCPVSAGVDSQAVDSQFTKLVQAELDTLRAVSTVPPSTTSFIVSTTPEPPRGPSTDLRASMKCFCCCWMPRVQDRYDKVGQGEGGEVSAGRSLILISKAVFAVTRVRSRFR